MAHEIEAKLRVESHEPVRRRLQALGAGLLTRALETNHIFDDPDGSLRGRGYGLRIRSALDMATNEPYHTLTLKGPVAAGPFKSREELEVQISVQVMYAIE